MREGVSETQGRGDATRGGRGRTDVGAHACGRATASSERAGGSAGSALSARDEQREKGEEEAGETRTPVRPKRLDPPAPPHAPPVDLEPDPHLDEPRRTPLAPERLERVVGALDGPVAAEDLTGEEEADLREGRVRAGDDEPAEEVLVGVVAELRDGDWRAVGAWERGVSAGRRGLSGRRGDRLCAPVMMTGLPWGARTQRARKGCLGQARAREQRSAREKRRTRRTRSSSRKLSADAVYDMVSVPCSCVAPSASNPRARQPSFSRASKRKGRGGEGEGKRGRTSRTPSNEP